MIFQCTSTPFIKLNFALLLNLCLVLALPTHFLPLRSCPNHTVSFACSLTRSLAQPNHRRARGPLCRHRKPHFRLLTHEDDTRSHPRNMCVHPLDVREHHRADVVCCEITKRHFLASPASLMIASTDRSQDVTSDFILLDTHVGLGFVRRAASLI